jgi:DNA-binding response OmpR family regulator
MKKILIADDSPTVMKLVSGFLEGAGYEVISASDGQEGLEKARTEHPDLIILDVMMPKMGGFEVCRMLKFDSNFKNTPIIMLSEKQEDVDKLTGTKVGADDYIPKPFKSQELLDKIQDLLQ